MTKFYSIGNDEVISLEIGTKDFTSNLFTFSANYGSVDYDAGISFITGTIVLKQTFAYYTDFDYRFNSDFQVGTRVRLTKNGRRLPIIGTTYILNANYDLQQTLTLDIGCQLGLHNARTLKNSLLCIDYDAKFPIATAIKNLLVTAGVTTSIDVSPIGGLLAQPISVNDGDSLIQTAANLAANQGFLLYQDNSGAIRTKDLANISSQYFFVGDTLSLYNYSLNSNPEVVIKTLGVSYNKVDVLGLLDTTSDSAEFGGVKLSVATSADRNAMTTQAIYREYRNNVLLSTTTVDSIFEPSPPASRNGTISTRKACFDGELARILKRTTTTIADNTEVLKEWYARKSSAAIPTGYTLSGTITTNRQVEEWNYSRSSNTYKKTLYQPLARVVPNIADLALGSTKTPIVDKNPLSEVIAEQTIENYTAAAERSGRFTRIYTVLRASNLVKPTEVLTESTSPLIPLETVVANGSRLVPITQDIEYGVSLPTYDVFEVSPEVISDQINFLVDSNTFAGQLGTLDLGDHYLPDEPRLRAVAENYLKFNNGRAYACTAASSLPPANLWSSISPLGLAKINEEIKAIAYIMDSPAITYSDTELVFSFSGSVLGEAERNDNYFADVIVPFGILAQTTTLILPFTNASTTIRESFGVPRFVTFTNASASITEASASFLNIPFTPAVTTITETNMQNIDVNFTAATADITESII
jgi:hypothetical protein